MLRYVILPLVAVIVGCSKEGNTLTSAQARDTSCYKGYVDVKLTPEATSRLKVQVSGNSITTGISGLDSLNDLYRVTDFAKSFPYVRDRKSDTLIGLYRWYEVRLDTAFDVYEVTASYQSLPEVEVAGCSHPAYPD